MTGCVASDNSDATLRVTNQSDFVIDELYVAPVGTSTWGRNLLGSAGLFPTEDITLSVACDFYDARLIDENRDECIIRDLDLCANDADWVLTNAICGDVFNAVTPEKKLEHAQKVTQRAAAKAAAASVAN